MKRNSLLLVMMLFSLSILIKNINNGITPILLSLIALLGFCFLFYYFNFKVNNEK